MDTESVSNNFRLIAEGETDIHLTIWKSTKVVARITNINLGAPQA